MKLITESAEHHFLTTLDRVKKDSGGWIGFHFSFSWKLKHDDILDRLDHIRGKIHKVRKDAEAFATELQKDTEDLVAGKVYLFADCDVVMVIRPQNDGERKRIQELFKVKSQKAGAKISTFSELAKEIYNYQKMADKRMLGSRRMTAYEMLADANKVQSIPLRRSRHDSDEKVVLIVEDDRFTASYAANILNKEYDVVLAKTGEDAIISYIEHAPDIVLMDIHLPGLSGHEALQAIYKADEKAYSVVLSVDTVKENVVQATKTGAAGFVKKPFSKERILTVVEKSPYIKGSKK